MNTLDPTSTSTRDDVQYVVQIGRIGGTVAEPVAYWQDYFPVHLTRETAEDQLDAVRKMLRNTPRFHTGQSRLVKRTVTTTIQPLED